MNEQKYITQICSSNMAVFYIIYVNNARVFWLNMKKKSYKNCL